MSQMSNLASVVYKRTYAREDNGTVEDWPQTVERVISGNVRGLGVSEAEIQRLRYFLSERKAGPAGRGWWFSGAKAQDVVGGAALTNCWFQCADNWMNFVEAQDLLMLGGGVGLSVEHKYVSKLPRIKKGVAVRHRATKDALFIVPDSREGWCELTRRVLESFFVTGKSFDYSTVCIRGYGEKINGFGGTASGPLPLIALVEKLSALLGRREGKTVRPVDAMDIICCIGEMVVAGNVRRSAILVLGDCWDKEYLKSKRWDLGPIPTQRAMANLSVIVDDIEDVHPLFWKTYENGEPFGIVNRANIQKYARMGDLQPDTAVGTNPCVLGETLILTRAGYRRIDSLTSGPVDVWNGFEWSTVSPRITGRDQPMVRVELSSGQSLTCTEAHRFVLAVGYNGTTKSVLAKDLVPGDKLAKATYPVLLDGCKPEVDAYTQGFYSGDGDSGSTTIHLYGSAKLACASRMSGALGSYSGDQDRTHFGASEVLSKSFVPASWDLQGRLDWFAGLMDSDGCELKEGGAQISSIDRSFLLDVQRMLTTCGVASKTVLMHPAGLRKMPDGKRGSKLFECQDCWRLLVGAVQMQDLKRIGYHGSRVTFDKKPQRDASQFVKVVSVTPAERAEVVYCFNEPKRHLGCFDGIVTGQCAEACLEDGEPCNLQDIALPRLTSIDEFVEASRLMHRWGKRVTMVPYHIEKSSEVVRRNRRVGTGITGCLQSPLFTPETLDLAYNAIQDENLSYSKELGIPKSIRTTTIKPSGTVSKMYDMKGYEGIHAAWSRHYIQRIRFSAADPMVQLLAAAGHHIEPVVRFDGTFDHNTVVVDFYEQAPASAPVADEGWDTWKQLDVLKMAQKHWADQSISVTVYYKKEELTQVKAWLGANLQYIKTISFLCHSDHGFKQAPKEAISKEMFEKMASRIKNIKTDGVAAGDELGGSDCAGGACPIK